MKIEMEKINEILSQAIVDFIESRITAKKALTLAKLAQVLEKNINNTELKSKIEYLEMVLKRRG